MIINMNLNDKPYKQILSGEKTIELRLYDNKRSKINIGDIIIFTNLSDDSEQIAARVEALYRGKTFADMFQDIQIEKCGFRKDMSIAEAAMQMEQYYSSDEVSLLGVLGIRIKVIEMQTAIEEQEERQRPIFERFFPDGMN